MLSFNSPKPTKGSDALSGSDYVDRVKTTDVRVERGLGGLGGRPVEDGSDTCRVAGDVIEPTNYMKLSKKITRQSR
jgi:hypothetical protein